MNDLHTTPSFKALDEGRLQPVDKGTTLKPCPFCGGEAEFQLDHGRNTIGVGCKKCLCNHVPSWQGSDAQRWAAEAWNARHQSGRTGAGEAQELADYRKLVREQQSRISKMEGALMARPPISPTDGSWWYPEGDTSSDACCSGPSEVLEGAADQMAEGEARIVVIERALELPDVYAVLRVFTDEEKEARDDDER